MMASFIRYWVLSIVTVSGFVSTIRCIRVRSSPPRAACGHLMVGGSCWWSPANTTRSALRMAAQQAASSACVASSMNRVPKWRCSSTRFALPISVHATTSACCRISSWILSSNSSARRCSRCRWLCCRREPAGVACISRRSLRTLHSSG